LNQPDKIEQVFVLILSARYILQFVILKTIIMPFVDFSVIKLQAHFKNPLSHFDEILYQTMRLCLIKLKVTDMRKLLLSLGFMILTVSLTAQVKFDLGLKGGVNFSKISFDIKDYSAESVTKSHFGAFARIGYNRIFVQPEFYFSGKGGDVITGFESTITSFDFKTMDIPVLLGFSLIKGKLFDLHLVAGPVFSNIRSLEIDGSDLADKFYKSNYMAIQYGLGIDIWRITLDARMENGLGEFYKQPDLSGKNQTFMLSAGFKIF
jgi:hypothetical protein